MAFAPEEMTPLSSHKIRRRRNQIRVCAAVMGLALAGRGAFDIFYAYEYIAAIPFFVMAIAFPLAVLYFLRSTETLRLFYVSAAALLLAMLLLLGSIFSFVVALIHKKPFSSYIAPLVNLGAAFPCLILFILVHTLIKLIRSSEDSEEDFPFGYPQLGENETDALVREEHNRPEDIEEAAM